MLDDLVRREDVSRMLVDICNSARYYDKKASSSIGYQIYSGPEQILFLFYDALFKYKIIIKDMDFFSEFLEQIDKLIRKIDNFSEIGYGINRVIGRICANKLGINDIDTDYAKNKVLRYIYQNYIVEGYYIHGFASHYYNSIMENGFTVEQYNNLYPKFLKVQEILKKKKHLGVLDKDFTISEVSFTDSFLMGCYYSVNAPMYFSKFVSRNEFIDEPMAIDAYSVGNYDLCLKNLYKVSSKLRLNDAQRNVFLDAFKSEWRLLDKSNSNIALMLVPRKMFDIQFDIDKFIEETKDNSFVEAVCKILGQKNNVTVSRFFRNEDIVLVNLYSTKKYIKEEKKESLASELEKTFIRSDDEFAFSNTYGKVSILLLLGTLLITVGVILTMISFS